MPKTRRPTVMPRDRKTIAFLAFMAVALVACAGMFWATSVRATDKSDYVSAYTPPPPFDDTLIANAPGAAVMQKLAAASATGRKPVVLALGSSVTAGSGVADPAAQSWTALLRTSISKYAPVEWITSGHVGYTAKQLMNEGFVDEAITARPDVIFYETLTLNDLNAAGGFVELSSTIAAFNANIDRIQKGSPDTLIVVQSPNPRTDNIATPKGVKYTDYVAAVLNASRQRGLLTVDIATALQQRADEYAGVRGILTTDGIHPNATGYQMWASELQKFLGIPASY